MRLIFVLLFLFAVYAPTNADAKPVKVLYWQKDADGASLIEAMVGIDLNPIVFPGSEYYNERNLGSNAVLCGEQINGAELQEFVGAMLDAGARIQYVGPFYAPELNSLGATIDLRSINGPEYFESSEVWTVQRWEATDWQSPNLCGYDPSFDPDTTLMNLNQ